LQELAALSKTFLLDIRIACSALGVPDSDRSSGLWLPSHFPQVRTNHGVTTCDLGLSMSCVVKSLSFKK